MARVLISLLLIAQFAYAEPLLWPLPFGKTLTGGFADSRPDHFHGGVDLRTGPEPRDIIAPTAGFVERIAIAPNGYGRTIYFRLSDGRTAVFGHLSAFVPRLEKMLRDTQLVHETFRVDFATDSTSALVWFKRGETICYTGQSGMGPPHLHFEIREGAVQTDPLANFSPRDTQKPVITNVRWIDREHFTPESSGNPCTQSPARIEATSPVAFFIQCYDPGPWGRHSIPSRIQVSVDGKVKFTQHCGRINLIGDKDIYEQLVWAERVNDTDVRRLFLPPKIHQTEVKPEQGWISGSTTHHVEIVVTDRAGNRSSKSVYVNATKGEYEVSTSVLQTTESFRLESSGDALASWVSLNERTSSEINMTPDLCGFGDRVKLTYQLTDHSHFQKYFYSIKSNGSRRPLWRIPSEVNPSVMSCYIMKAGTYGIAEDYTAPKLLLSTKQKRIHFKLTDSESGIDDSSVRCRVDGQTAIAEYEYEENGGYIWTQAKLSTGSHRIEFTAADRAGNQKSWNETVSIPK